MNSVDEKRVLAACKELSPEVIRLISEPSVIKETRVSVPFSFERKNGKKSEKTTLWLKCNIKQTCHIAHAKYEYEGIVTRGGENGPPFAVDRIDLHITRSVGSAEYDVSEVNTHYCPHTDHVYNLPACGPSCVTATATHNGQSWSTSKTCV